MMARMSGNPALIERFPAGTLGCWAITEPGHGSDLINFDGTLSHPGGHDERPNCIARLDGNQFVITGQKSAWVSNGTIADAAALFCSVDMGDGRVGGGVFVVPLNEGGVSKGKPTDKIGQRALNQGEIFFNNLKVPADSLVVPPEGYRAAADRVLCLANASMGTTFAGCARAAFELATDYAKTRVQGGVAIFAHQSMKARLFKMYQKVEAARALNHRVVRINTGRETPLLELAIASKVTSTQAAFEVASDALQVFGGAGISRDCPIEKIFRDARISMIEDGCNEVLGMVAAARF
jgi:alkylation response protein AidB-like acyl-CoA dehydrogenase